MITSFLRRKGVTRRKCPPESPSENAKGCGPSESEASTSSSDARMDALRSQVETLQVKLDQCQTENDIKQRRIQSLENQMEMLCRNEKLEEKLASYLLIRAEELLTKSQSEDDTKETKIESLRRLVDMLRRNKGLEEQLANLLLSQPESCDNETVVQAESIANPTNKRPDGTKRSDAISQIQRWILVEGGDLPDIESLISRFADFCLSLGVPVDRIVIFSTASHPNLSSYVWKWEFSKHFREKEVRSDLHYKPDEPVRLLMEGKAMEFRMRAGIQENITGCKWFTSNNFQDYFALPIYHRGEFKGAVAWSTKKVAGFTEEHIRFFRKSLIAFSPVLRCHMNDVIIRTFMDRLEDEIREQTMELAAANKSLAQANEKIVQQAESQLRNFAMMSHEIRTPLNCIVGLSNLLLSSDDLDPSLQESIEMITSSGDLLLAVVDDVLDYSKLAAGKVETKVETIQTQQVIRAVVTSVDIRAKATGVDLRTKLADNLPADVETDSRRLQQILYNLLGNAIKFGRQGKIVDFTVDVVCRDGSSTDHVEVVEKRNPCPDDIVRFTVKDYGRGIHPSELHKIFQPFQQAATNDPSHGGTGLGLAITRQLVRVLGGTISVESEYGSWCKFTVLLPKNPERPIIPSCKDEQRSTFEEALPFPNVSQRSTLGGNSSSFEDDDFSSSDDDTCSSSTSFSTPSNYVHKHILTHVRHISLPKVPSLFPGEGIGLFEKHRDDSVEATKNSILGGDFSGLNEESIFTIDEIKNLLSSTRNEPMDQNVADQGNSTDDCREPPSPPPQESGSRKMVEFDKLRVLIAEDNQINQKVLHRTLTRIGLTDIDIVSDGKQAVEAQETKGYDVIFMDLQMPVMDGLEATGIISSRKRLKNESYPKIAFLTAHALQDYQDKAADSGGDGFISKPFKLEMLKELITRFMEG